MLLAEDDPLNRKVTAAMLRKRGYDVVAVPDGPSATAAAERDDIDVVLMDIQMPGMDGVTAARHIRDAWRRAGRPAPIIAFTGNMYAEELVRGPDGFDGYVAKPFRLAELIGGIEKAVAEFAGRTRDRTDPPDGRLCPHSATPSAAKDSPSGPSTLPPPGCP